MRVLCLPCLQAEVRERERERRVERKVQKEREAEGEEFKDKEAFVTSAYRKKMEEMEKAEAEEARREQIENVLDVRKQKDMSGFYRHLYRQTHFEEKGQVGHVFSIHYASVIFALRAKRNIAGFFLDISKKTQAEKNFSEFSK